MAKEPPECPLRPSPGRSEIRAFAALRSCVEGTLGEPSDDDVPRQQGRERGSRGEMRPENGLAGALAPHEIEEITAVRHDEDEHDEENAACAVEVGLEVALHVAVGGTADRDEKRRRRERVEPEPPRLRRVAEDGKILIGRLEGAADEDFSVFRHPSEPW